MPVTNDMNILFIHPTEEPHPQPILDELTTRMQELIRNADDAGDYTQHRGFHTCTGEGCVIGSSRIYKIAGDHLTNDLAPHYLMYHRREIPVDELYKVRRLLGVR